MENTSPTAAIPGQHLLIDCDPGTDDCLAIMMALSRHPGVKTVAITCVNGNAGVEQVAINAMRVVKLFDMVDQVPVFRGCPGPIISTPDEYDSTCHKCYHGEDGFGDAPDVEPRADDALRDLIQKEHAVHAIIRLSKEYRGRLEIVAIGPLTNLAMAARLDPDLPKRIKMMHILGGTSKAHGNTTPAAEFNFYADPEAAHVTLHEFSQCCTVRLTAYEVTTDHATPSTWHEKWIKKDDNPKRQFFRQIFRLAAEIEAKAISSGRRTGYTICDAYAMCSALIPACVIGSKMLHVGIELGGSMARGSLIIDHRGRRSLHLTARTVEVVERMDMEIFKNLLEETFN